MAMRRVPALLLCVGALVACGHQPERAASPPPPRPSSPPRPPSPPAASPTDRIHAALVAAQSPAALWALVDPQRGLSVQTPTGRGDELADRLACSPAELSPAALAFAADRRWRCNPAASRCISSDPQDGDTVYYFRGGFLDTIAHTANIYLDENETEIAGIVDAPRGPCFAPAMTSTDAIRTTLTAALAARPLDHFLGTLVDPARGLVLHDAADGTSRVVCAANAFTGGAPYEMRRTWSCDAALRRCATTDGEGDGGYVFYLRDGALDAIVSYGAAIPATDGPRVQAALASDRHACGFREDVRAFFARRTDGNEPDPAAHLAHPPRELWTFTHPSFLDDDSEGMDAPQPRRKRTPAVTRRYCGAAAARRAEELILAAGSAGPDECGAAPTSCSMFQDSDGVGAETRLIPSADGTRWVIAQVGSNDDERAAIERQLAAFLRTAAAKPCP
ncbi:MAG: hypothetical protein K8W52_39925 [Deltaproteobacteria bacterium]|nr:hypothetical protein [Deltaproteobacteria bacterium]